MGLMSNTTWAFPISTYNCTITGPMKEQLPLEVLSLQLAFDLAVCILSSLPVDYIVPYVYPSCSTAVKFGMLPKLSCCNENKSGSLQPSESVCVEITCKEASSLESSHGLYWGLQCLSCELLWHQATSPCSSLENTLGIFTWLTPVFCVCLLVGCDWLENMRLGLEQGPTEVQPEIARVKFATRELWMQSISSLLAPVLLRIDAGYLRLHHPVSNVNYLIQP